jgi:DNA-binding beta-propeller fold protein YncE
MLYLSRLRYALPLFLLGLLAGCGGGGGGGGDTDPIADSFNGVTVDLPHNGIVYDTTRQIYYASVKSVDPVRGNRIAVLDRTGTIVSTSPQLGSEPSALAVSADGSFLYVGLEGTGELVQLSLPSFSVLATIRLPSDPFSGRQAHAEQISVSPTGATLIAVSLAYTGVSPRHAGVVLISNMTPLPDRTQAHTGSNRIAFGKGGGEVFGFNNETSEFGLRKLTVKDTGVSEAVVTPVSGAIFSWDLEVSPNALIVGNQAYDPDTLAPSGTVAGATFHCVSVSTHTRLACFSQDFGVIIVAESSSFVRIGQVDFPETSTTAAYRLIAGPSSQVVASSLESGRLYFVNSELFQ